MGQVLQVLTPDDQQALDRLLAYAKANPTTEAQIKATMAGDRPPVGDYLEHQWVWPQGFRCVFSYEHQPIGLCRHLSVSVYDRSSPNPQVPSPKAMNTIGQAFGFTAGKLDSMWIDPETKSINMVQKVEVCDGCGGSGITHGQHSKEFLDDYAKNHGNQNPNAPLVVCQDCEGSGEKKRS